MDDNRISTIMNLSSQANIAKAKQSNLSQFNFVIILGIESIGNPHKCLKKIPITINISKDVELDITGMEGTAVNDEKDIRIYCDRKVTNTSE